MLPAVNMPRQALAMRLSVSALVASLPLIYVTLLRPPASALPGDTAFWFLMSNCVVAAIVAADDAGTLFLAAGGSKGDDGELCGGDGDNLSYDVSGCQPVASSPDAMVPSLGAFHVDDYELPPAAATGSSVDGDRALPAISIHGDEEEDADVTKQIEDVEVAIEPVTEKKNTPVKVEDQGEEVTASTFRASGEAIPSDELLAVAKANDKAVVDEPPEPWPTPVVTSSQRLVEEDEAAEEWPTIARCSRSADDVLQDDDGGEKGSNNNLRRSATEGSSSPPAEEESEYWELSDEELNRRVEEFIARFNTQMRLQEDYAAGV